MIRIKPLKSAAKPMYPNRNEARMDPLLLKPLPGRWALCKKAMAAAGILASITASLAACAPANAENSATAMKSFTTYCEPTNSASSTASSSALAGVPLPPDLVTEADALGIVRNAAGGIFAKALTFDAKEINRPLSYMRYNIETKSFMNVSPFDNAQKVNIDVYDARRNIGVEYMNDESKTGNEASAFIDSEKNIEHADKNTAYVLVLDGAHVDGQKENAVLKEQIEAFITWLKAEGIL